MKNILGLAQAQSTAGKTGTGKGQTLKMGLVIAISLALMASIGVLGVGGAVAQAGSEKAYTAVMLDTGPIWSFPAYESSMDELEDLKLDVDYYYSKDGIEKKLWLGEIAEWNNMFYLHCTHGLEDRFICWTGGSIYDYEVEEALENRPHYRLVILCSCYSGAGTLPDAFVHNTSGKKRVVLGLPGRGGGLQYNEVEWFLDYLGNNPRRTVYEAFQAMQEKFYHNEDDTVFLGDDEMLCSEVFNPLWGDANQDGNINALDIMKLKRMIAKLDPLCYEADVNQDGKVNALDRKELEKMISQAYSARRAGNYGSWWDRIGG